jgi:hypothetical protein
MASQIERSTVRLKAKECERLAEAMSDPDSREQLRSAARQWLEVVEQVELLDASDLNHP